MAPNYEFCITGMAEDKEKVVQICNLFDDLEISYQCSFKKQNIQETYKNSPRNVQEKLILAFCKEAKTLKEIVQYCGYKSVCNFREKYIKPLIVAEKLQMTIPEQPKNRNQKYIDISRKFYLKEGEIK